MVPFMMPEGAKSAPSLALNAPILPLQGVTTSEITGFRDGHALDQLHHEVGPARLGSSPVQHVGDVRVVHHGQGLALGLETGDYFPGVHARLDDLQGHGAPYRLALFGHEHYAKPAFADLLQEPVMGVAIAASP